MIHCILHGMAWKRKLAFGMEDLEWKDYSMYKNTTSLFSS